MNGWPFSYFRLKFHTSIPTYMRKMLFLLTIILSAAVSRGQDAEQKLKEKGIELTTPSTPLANYVNVVRTGKVGKDLTIEQGYEAARIVAINHLAVLKAELGDLNKVKRIVKVLGMVNCEGNFTDHPKVINGYSDMMVAVFGEKGKHARSAVGMGSLPNNIAVEVEVVVEVE